MKKLVSLLLVALMALTVFAACAETEKPTIRFYGKCVEYVSGPMMTDALEEALADKYNIESIQIDWSNLGQVVLTGIASNDPCDVYNYNAAMDVLSTMALDLTPYLEADPELKGWFSEASLAEYSYEGKVIALPWEVNFPVMIGNKTIFDEVGIEIPDAWTYEEFSAACEKMKDAGYFPLGNATDLNRSYWFYINAELSLAASQDVSAQYANGEIAYDSELSKAAMTAMKSLYDNGYVYPGEGAVTAKSDEIRAAYYQGKLAMITETAAQASGVAAETEFETVIIPWPSAGEISAVMGGGNYFFIPKNCKNPDAAVEVLKTFLSPSIQAIHAEQGYIPVNLKAEISNEVVLNIMKQMDLFRTIRPLTAATYDYLCNNLLADLVLNGGVETAAANAAIAASMD